MTKDKALEMAREALLHAQPLVRHWCHTQGDNQQFHDETNAPISAALTAIDAAVNSGGEEDGLRQIKNAMQDLSLGEASLDGVLDALLDLQRLRLLWERNSILVERKRCAGIAKSFERCDCEGQQRDAIAAAILQQDDKEPDHG